MNGLKGMNRFKESNALRGTHAKQARRKLGGLDNGKIIEIFVKGVCMVEIFIFV